MHVNYPPEFDIKDMKAAQALPHNWISIIMEDTCHPIYFVFVLLPGHFDFCPPDSVIIHLSETSSPVINAQTQNR